MERRPRRKVAKYDSEDDEVDENMLRIIQGNMARGMQKAKKNVSIRRRQPEPEPESEEEFEEYENENEEQFMEQAHPRGQVNQSMGYQPKYLDMEEEEEASDEEYSNEEYDEGDEGEYSDEEYDEEEEGEYSDEDVSDEGY